MKLRILSCVYVGMLIITFLSASKLIAQTVNTNFVDGAIYFQLNENVDITYQVKEDKSVDILDIPGISAREMINEFKIIKITCPYNIDNDPKLLRTFKVEFADIQNVDKLLKFLMSKSSVRYAEKISLGKLFTQPNDPYYSSKSVLDASARAYVYWNWHLSMINAEKAWEVQKGSNLVKVGVIDGAIWAEHPDLQIPSERLYDGNTDKVGSAFPDGFFDQIIEGDPRGYLNDVAWKLSHGTHCAGNIAAINNNGIGVSSLAGGWGTGDNGVELYAARIDNSLFQIDMSNSDKSINWMANQGCRVISMSYGSEQSMQTSQDIINAAYKKGMICIAAAGNDSSQIKQYPAAYEHVISVGSVNSNGKLSDFSEYGDWVDIAAPGGLYYIGTKYTPACVLSCTYSKNIRTNLHFESYGNPVTNDNDSYYDMMEGTSMACPMVAGLVSLMLSHDPSMWFEKVQDVLRATSKPLNVASAHKIRSGVGYIDAYAALTFTGINDVKKTNDVFVYPNPASDYIMINLLGDQTTETKVVLTNMLGSVVHQGFVEANEGSFQMNVSNFDNGVYFLNVHNNGTVMTKKIIINK